MRFGGWRTGGLGSVGDYIRRAAFDYIFESKFWTAARNARTLTPKLEGGMSYHYGRRSADENVDLFILPLLLFAFIVHSFWRAFSQ